MSKKALVSTVEPEGDNGHRVLEIVEAGSEFEVHSDLVWKDCPDSITQSDYWWKPSTSEYKKLPHTVDKSTAGTLATDADGNPTEEYVWDWDNEVWTKVQVINQ